jgi:hypothetical protein
MCAFGVVGEDGTHVSVKTCQIIVDAFIFITQEDQMIIFRKNNRIMTLLKKKMMINKEVRRLK